MRLRAQRIYVDEDSTDRVACERGCGDHAGHEGNADPFGKDHEV
jgi:hypothetical protein